MTTPHKWADVIKAWADGKPIERRFMSDKWREIVGHGTPPFDDTRNEWRIKPETVKYRRYIYRGITGPVVMVVHSPYEEGKVESVWRSAFIRWIDTEWQEEEV